MRHLVYLLSILLFVSCSRNVFKTKWTTEKAPENFVARFETSQGSFDVKVTREWSPLAADRFYQLVRHHYFDSAIFYRVVADRIAQFGGTDTNLNRKWEKAKIPDEPVVQGNNQGRVSFARAGRETRSTEIYINLRDNPMLDTIIYNEVKGFPSFGEVISGMDVVSALYSGYGEISEDQYKMMYSNRRAFLAALPMMDKVLKAYIIRP